MEAQALLEKTKALPKATKALPVVLRRLAFRDSWLEQDLPDLDDDIDKEEQNATVRLVRIGVPIPQPAHIPGYFVMSSAPPNIENAKEMDKAERDDAADGVQEIARYLYDVYTRGGPAGPAPELIIAVHGYNSGRSSVRDWYKNIFHYINRYDHAIPVQRNQVFIGYRWPSENIELKRLGEAFRAMPPLPLGLMLMGFLGAFILFGLELAALFKLIGFVETLGGFFLALFLSALVGLSTIVVTLLLLRMAVYFRDRYRAENFGVLDLVELLRQIDRAMVKLKAEDIKQQRSEKTNSEKDNCEEIDPEEAAVNDWKGTPRKVRISFLGHSMGGFVVTNVVRILSDVFDARSIGNQPPPDIGSVFKLERLILASPDIPILTIVSSRANFLSSSLRRFTESYLFSSEGDLALRIASATANYFMFPSRTREMGHRLGNVSLTLSSEECKDSSPKGHQVRRKGSDRSRTDYGIINFSDLREQFVYDGSSFEEMLARLKFRAMEKLFLTYNFFGKKQGYNTLKKLLDNWKKVDQTEKTSDSEATTIPNVTIADLFTYFDCTDYQDVKFSLQRRSCPKAKGILTFANNRKAALSWWDYFLLMVWAPFRGVNVHGGYFEGKFTQELIYRIAFLGFTGYLNTVYHDPRAAFDPHTALSKLDQRCRELGIQGFLSPMRYRVNILGKDVTDDKQKLLEVIE